MGRRLKLWSLLLGMGIFLIHPGPLLAQNISRIIETKKPVERILKSKANKKNELSFDLEVIPFAKTAAGKKHLKERGALPKIRDQYGYPQPKTIFYNLMLKERQKLKLRKKSSEPLKKSSAMIQSYPSWLINDAYAMDSGSIPGEVNCRANTSVTTGYFKAYFEDVALGNSFGYNHPTYGLARRTAICQVLEEIATLVNLADAGVTPDILFTATLPPNTPSGALASASTYYGKIPTSSGLDNGTLHYHITKREDPTPGLDEYDAVVNTNWSILSGSYQWSIDVPLIPGGWNPNNSFDFITVMRHEVFHALGFAGAMSDSVNPTGIEIFHNSFNENGYSGSPTSNANRYFNLTQPLTPKIQSPVGAPSSWFVNNTSIYQGKTNSPGTSLSPPRALYTPLGWQQGSSLSHFDMNRAPTPVGTVYVMHPNIGPTEVRSFHNDELEVLCHLGYQVENLCDTPSPYATDDITNLTASSQCVSILQNDLSFTTSPPGGNANLVIQDVQTVFIPTGTSVIYYSLPNCTGTANSFPNGAMSLMVTGNTNLQPVGLKYSVLDTVSNRTSQTATVYLSNCTAPANEYVCNGDFELGAMPGISMGYGGNAAFYYYKIPFWVPAFSSPDFTSKNIAGVPGSYCNLPYAAYPSLPASQQTWVDMKNGQGSYAGVFLDYGYSDNEMLSAKLKQPLTVGQAYKFSFDVVIVGKPDLTNPSVPRTIYGGLHTLNMDCSFNLPNCWGGYSNYLNLLSSPAMSSDIIIQEDVPVNYNVPNAVWSHLERIFIAQSPYEYMVLYAKQSTTNYSNHTVPIIVDNVSITKVDPEHSISGVVYNDTNQNGSWGTGEYELTNRTVGLYSNTSPPVLLQTANTTITPPYRYTFPIGSNYQSSYLVALNPENTYQTITEPVSNSSTLISGFLHVKQVSFSGGHLTNQNFGVVLTGQSPLVSVTANATSGCGESSGSIQLTASGGTPPYTYSWIGPNGFTSNLEDLSFLAPGSYSVTATDATGSMGSASVTVPNPIQILVNGTATQPSGSTGGSITATATGGTGPYSYTWSNGQVTSTISNLVPGSYSVTVTDASSCTGTANFVILAPGPDNIVCAGAPPTTNYITATNSTNNVPLYSCYLYTGPTGASECLYNFANPAGVNPNGWNTACPAAVAGSNCCEWTKACGGGNSGNPTTVINGTTTNTSIGNAAGAITLTVTGQGPFTYQWNNGQTTQNLSNLPAGTYIVTVTNANGCPTQASFTVRENPPQNGACCKIKPDANPLVDCSDPIFNPTLSADNYFAHNRCIKAGNGIINGNSCYWDFTNPSCCYPGAQNCGSVPGTACTSPSVSIPYPFTSLNNGNLAYQELYHSCLNQSEASGMGQNYYCCVTLPPPPSPSPSPTCAPPNTLIPYPFSQLNDQNDPTGEIRSNCKANTINFADYTQATCCVNLGLKLMAKYKPSCDGLSGAINLSVSGGTAPYHYSWSNGQLIEDINNLPPGNYTVNVTDNATPPISASLTVNIPVIGPVMITGVSSPATSPGYNNGSINITVTPSMTYIYQWLKSGSTWTSTVEDPTGLSPGSYTVTATNKYGCKASKTFTVKKKFTVVGPVGPANPKEVILNK